MLRQTVVVPLLAGVVAFTFVELCLFSLRALTPLFPDAMLDPPPYPVWSHVTQQVLSAIQVVGPGMLGGWLAERSGWVIGATIGLVGQLAAWAVSAALGGGFMLEAYGTAWAIGVVVFPTITCAVGGVAGVAVCTRPAASNLSSNADARDYGSAG